MENSTVNVGGVEFSHQEINQVVDTFYTRVQKDPLLSVPFQSVHDWPEHIERLTHFWWIRFGGKPYMFTHYNPVAKHFYAGFNAEFLARWLSLFHEVLYEKLKPEQAKLWQEISIQMGKGLSIRNEMLRKAVESQQMG